MYRGKIKFSKHYHCCTLNKLCSFTNDRTKLPYRRGINYATAIMTGAIG